ncbi:MAG: hypothetical protein JXA66_05925 [Oligoflexia bacterium]|nr:hypothetical protein [Oligoflexia bacterium]
MKSIFYECDNVGRELEFNFKINDKSTNISTNLICGNRNRYNKIIFDKFTILGEKINIPVFVNIIENDPVYSDLGTANSNVELTTGNIGKFSHTFSGFVQGLGRREKTKTARFDFVLEIELKTSIRYVSNVLPDGWLLVKFENGLIHPLPYSLKVDLYNKENGREYFEIMEGQLQRRKASVTLKENGSSYLIKKDNHTGSAELIFDRKKKKLKITGLGTFKTETSNINPIPNGVYDVELPYEPHPLGLLYLIDSKFSKTWFRIGHSGDRFLHVGRHSEGCVTVKDRISWTKIYKFLIHSRKDSKNIGTLKVE